MKTLPVLFLFILFLCASQPCAAASPPLVLGGNSASAPLAGHLDIFDDNEGKLTIQEVSSPAMAPQFRPVRKAAPRSGYRSGFYWLRFTIATEATVSQNRLLELDMPYMRYLDLYLPREDGGFDLMQAGSSRPMSIRSFKHRNPVFPLVVNEKARTFYLRLDGTRRVVLPLTVWSAEAFGAMDSHRALIFGGYFGAMLVMMAYNLFIFLSLRDRSYLYYILDIFFFALFVFYHKGYLLEFITGEAPLINGYAFILAVPAVITGCAFCRNFLDTRRTTPLIDRLLRLNMVIAALCIPASFVVPPSIMIRAVSIISPAAVILGASAGVVCLLRGFRPARYYVSARIFRTLGTISFALAINNILPWNLLTLYGLQIASICEVLLLSFALADRINVLRREKNEAQAEAVRSSQLAALGELAAGVAHEINTPVNTIINSADLLLEGSNRAMMERDVAVIKDQGRRIATIIKSLLFFSRRPEHEMVPFPVAEMLQGTLNMFGARLRRENIKVTVRILPELPDVMVHPQQIEQVFLNLLTNAMHALDERHGDALNSKTLEITAFETSINGRPGVAVVFTDNGSGIPAALLDSVRNSFVTTRKNGTGLGLSISQQIMDKHGGSIGIESRAGEYAKVTIVLPSTVTFDAL